MILGLNPCSVSIICIYIITISPAEDSLSSLRMSLAGQKKCNHQRWWLRSLKLRSFSCLASVQNNFLRFSMSVFVHALIISISDIDIFLIIFYRGFIFPYFHFSQAPEWETYGWHRHRILLSAHFLKSRIEGADISFKACHQYFPILHIKFLFLMSKLLWFGLWTVL